MAVPRLTRFLLAALPAVAPLACGDEDYIATNEIPPEDSSVGASAGSTAAGGRPGSGGAPGAGGTPQSDGAAGSPSCTPGEVVNLGDCEICGVSRRKCDESGKLGDPVCEEQGECQAGAEESAPCGKCGTMKRTCTAGCTWSDFGACSGEGECAPGQTDTQACGNCKQGTQTRTCTASCSWGSLTTCIGGGTCAPGATRQGNCEACGHQVCQSNCTWKSDCDPKPGNQCLWKNGSHYRCCGVGRWEYCLSSCRWSGNCASCAGCCPNG
jgi:hypothetical protein